LTGYELITTKPEPIYVVKSQEDPTVRIINTPVY